jgi:hypothetical protein
MIGIMCLMNCIATRKMLLAEGSWAFTEEDGPDYSASLRPEKSRRSWRNKWKMKRLRNLERAEEAERREVDQILEKVGRSGMNSLSWSERRILRKATEHQRERDAEISKLRR